MIDITNIYKKIIEVDYEKIIINVIEGVCDYMNFPYESFVDVTLVDDETMREINLVQRRIDSATDVLSFPAVATELIQNTEMIDEHPELFDPESGELILGDIVISYDKVLDQSEEYGHSETRELAFLTTHSMLHLLGFDHEAEDERIEMEKLQDEILEKLGYTREV